MQSDKALIILQTLFISKAKNNVKLFRTLGEKIFNFFFVTLHIPKISTDVQQYRLKKKPCK